ncbi:MAG: glycosyltransferase [Halobacteriovoraceae bacterium]|nr:glycosyltransferase [Halobacteriovoraceae bacterium]
MSNKILFITARADVGGGPQHLLDLLYSFKDENIIPYVASPDEEPYAKHFKKLAFKYIKIPKRKFTLGTFWRIFKFLRSENIHLIHSHGRGAGMYSRLLTLSGLGWFFKFNIIHTFHGAHKENSLMGRIKFMIDWLLAPFSHKYICVSNSEKEKILKFRFAGPKKISVINLGVDVQNIKNQSQKTSLSEAKEKFGIRTKKSIVGYLSRLSYQKGIDILLLFIARWKKQVNDLPFHLYVAGEGEKRDSLTVLTNELDIKEDVTFLGLVKEPTQFLNCLDLYVSSSRGEGLPYSILEAMTLSIPCLLSDVTGHQNFKSDKAAEFFSIDDYEDFKTKATKLLETPSRMDHLKKAGLSTILNHYTINHMSHKTLALYDEYNEKTIE